MRSLRLLAAAALMALTSGCAAVYGPAPLEGPDAGPPSEAPFRASDFAWSQSPGHALIAGHLAFHQGPLRYSCVGATVILTPETPWSRRRMQVLYLSAERAALPAAEVRARTPQAPPGDSGPFIKRTTCDAADRFAFPGLPDGAWFVITVGKPVGGGAPNMALMRRVVTKSGKITAVDL